MNIKIVLFLLLSILLTSLLLPQEGVNIIIRTNLAEATVFLDNTRAGVTGPTGTKLLTAVPKGTHRLVIRKIGYKDVTENIKVDELSNQFQYNLTPAPGSTVELHLNCIIPGVDVQIDDMPAGKTGEDGKLVLSGIPAGTYTIKLEKDGYLTYKESIPIDEKNNRLNINLARKTRAARDETWGQLMLTCNTPGARLIIDGFLDRETKEGTQIIPLPPGDHNIKIEKPGYQTDEKKVTIGEKLASRLEFNLQPAKTNPVEIKKETPPDQPETGESKIKPEVILGFIIFLAAGVMVVTFIKLLKSPKSLGLMGKFELLEKLGQGGMATIYKAKNLTEKRISALKVMDAKLVGDRELVYKFFEEGRVIQKINEEFPKAPIVTVLDYGGDKEKSLGYPFIEMELIKGTSLLDLIKNNKGANVTIKQKLYISREVAKGLNAAHQLEIFHGDITPDNIIVNGEKVTLIDFGIAHQDDNRNFKNLDATVTGKPVYMSPEQCKGSSIDEKSDVYSLGVILFFMFCGTPPFIDKNPFEVMRKHQEESLPGINVPMPGEIKDLIRRMLEKEPSKRPETTEVIETFENLILWHE